MASRGSILTRLNSRAYPAKLRFARVTGRKSMKSVYGPRFIIDQEDETYRYYINGSYGFGYWDYLITLERDFVFLDIGANQGLFALGAAENSRCSRVLAFEPVQRTYELLKKNLAVNRADEKVHPINVAIGAECGKAHMRLTPGHSGGARVVTSIGASSSDEIEVVRSIDASELDAIVKPSHVAVIVKVDVEGYEMEVLHQLFRTSFVDKMLSLCIEFDTRWHNYEELCEFLEPRGFRLRAKFSTSASHYDMLWVSS